MILPTPYDRQLVEDAIERLVGLLDALDGDADLEPSLGAPEGFTGLLWAFPANDDREQVDEREPEQFEACGWQDEGDQTKLRSQW